MMKPYTGYAPKASSSKPECLPAGIYSAVIKGARVEDTQYGQRLIIALDVADGEHKGHYQNLFDWETQNGNFGSPKWKGTLRIGVPTGDGSEKDSWTKRSFEGNIWAIEQSNPGFTFDFDEKKLTGLKVGINVRAKEWEYNDMTGWTTEIGRLESLPEVLAGRVKPMKDRPLNKPETAATTDAQNGFTAVETSELPF